MRALKLLVILMGVLLLAGIVALGFAVDYRLKHPRPVAEPAAAAIGPAGAPSATTLDLPQGARVVGAEANGDRLVVRIELAGGGAELVVINLATGQPTATVTFSPKSAAP